MVNLRHIKPASKMLGAPLNYIFEDKLGSLSSFIYFFRTRTKVL